MWSDRYHYLNIFKDLTQPEFVSSRKLIAFLSSLPELRKTNDFNFKNSKALPFIDLQLVCTNNIDSWSSNDVGKETSLIAVVCAKTNEEEFRLIKEILVRISKFLQWKLVEEDTDEGIENYIHWEP